jgi:predicted AAA+ superfamily ATPase
MRAEDRLVIIDEVQKLPALLDEAQLMIDRDPQVRFIFTGSSARKLKGGQANLLAGRAWIARLHPLVSAELEFGHLTRRLNVGSLPAVFDSPQPREDLKAYVGVYLREEIRAEALVRSIESFSRFLEVAALTNGQLLDYASVSSDTGIPARTVREHYQVLEDTLIGFQLPPYRRALKRKPVATAKFYFFDVGVANSLLKRGDIAEGSELFGLALEHLILLELRAYLDYRRRDRELAFWRTHSGFEVDCLVGDDVGIEVKASRHVTPRDLRGLRALSEDIPLRSRIVVSLEARERRTDDGITILPVRSFLQRLWADELLASP